MPAIAPKPDQPRRCSLRCGPRIRRKIGKLEKRLRTKIKKSIVRTTFLDVFAAAGVFEHHLLDFLDPTTLTNLGMTCTAMKSNIPDGVRIARVERLSTKMVFWTQDDDDFAAEGADNGFSVYQAHKFRFLICGIGRWPPRTIQIRYNLINFVWDECDNVRYGEGGEGSTEIQVEVLQKTSDGWETIFLVDTLDCMSFDETCDCGGSGCELCYGFTVQGLDDEFYDHDLVCSNLSMAWHVLWMCAGHLQTRHGGPSLPFTVGLLPVYLHDFIPDVCTFVDNVEGDDCDRALVVDWTYKPAISVEEWREHILQTNVPAIERSDVREFELNELPWYRDDYDQERRLMARWLQSGAATKPKKTTRALD